MSVNVSQNSTSGYVSQTISKPVIVLMRAQGTAIVLLNAIVLITLMMKKRTFPAIYWLHIVCLAVNDILAGMANVFISFIDMTFISNSLGSCSIVIVFLFSSQAASLYNIFGICIYRCLSLRRHRISSSIWKDWHTIVSTSTAWILSICLCASPVILFSKPDDYIEKQYCSLESIFGADIAKGTSIIMGSFILPLMFTNILYAVLFCKSRSNTTRPCSTRTNSENGSMCTVSAMLLDAPCPIPPNRMTFLTNIAKVSVPQCRSNVTSPSIAQRSSDKATRETTSLSIQRNMYDNVEHRRNPVQLLSIQPLYEQNDPKPSTSSNNDCINSDSSNKTHVNSFMCSKPVDTPVQKHKRQYISGSILRQRRVFTLLCTILLFLNIFSWPAIISILLAGNMHALSLGRNTLLPLFTTICLNSAINPMLYTATIPEFRFALINILHGIQNYFKC